MTNLVALTNRWIIQKKTFKHLFLDSLDIHLLQYSNVTLVIDMIWFFSLSFVFLFLYVSLSVTSKKGWLYLGKKKGFNVVGGCFVFIRHFRNELFEILIVEQKFHGRNTRQCHTCQIADKIIILSVKR